ncbi:amidohydrolase/deacetylase family metallohydrolase [Daejeonella sp.]|jgi:dihydroorotase|uniref:amidohydrolase/deacetylase family metallohydrolase n=1 Tax=Daejeonella sp. TaxID=2805397 RepID=UPI0027B8EE80|nr:amidohydrolase/deacetylase family metallohydrolase [Daejeonella sp.]
MKNRFFLVFAFFIAAQFSVSAQTYTTILKGGHLIDPKNNIDRVMDVAIQDGKIAAIAQNIDPKLGKQVIDLTGKYVTPGLIDIHGHVFAGTDPDGQLENGFSSLPADGFTFRVGVTTIVDCGDSGAETFELFKKNVIDKSQTRVLAFLNISRKGMYGDENSLQQQNNSFFDPVLAADVAKHYPDLIVGFKVAHYHKSDWVAVDRTVEAGKIANLPIIVDFGGAVPRLSLEELFLRKMRPGDIFTHTYGQLIKTKETIVNLDTKKLYPHVIEARKRGIIFDVGHGGGSFTFSQAIPATQQGFFPETISTDLHTGSMNSAMKDQLNVMSKFMSMDMTLANVVKASTWSAAKAIRHEELGHLSVGAIADVTVLNVREGKFGFYDVARYKNEGKNLLECEMTIKDGNVVYDLNARSFPTAK